VLSLPQHRMDAKLDVSKSWQNESPGAKFGGAGAGFGLYVQANWSVCADPVSKMARL
jgi:hypothetical protein